MVHTAIIEQMATISKMQISYPDIAWELPE